MTEPARSSSHITPGRVVYALVLAACLILLVRQYGGWGFDAGRAAWQRRMQTLRPGDDEPRIRSRFRRVQALNRSYTIGIVAVTDHHPVFGAADYRVYDLGYYDMDKRVRHLAHITCSDGRIRKIDYAAAREPDAPDRADAVR